MKDLHKYQIEILRKLLFFESLSFGGLSIPEVPGNKLNYHINQLIKLGFITKERRNYSLTPKGIEFAGRIDTKAKDIFLQPKVGVALIVIDGNQILLGKRKKEQAKNEIGFFTEKIRIGEEIEEACKRCLQTETGLTSSSFEFVGVQRIVDKKLNFVRLDVILNLFLVKKTSGELLKHTIESENQWYKVTELSKLENLSKGIIETIKKVEDKDVSLQEINLS